MDFSTVGGELCTETAGGYGKSSVKLVAADRNRHKGKSRYWGSVLFYKHIILGTTVLLILIPLLGLGGMIYKYSRLMEDYQGLLHRTYSLYEAEAVENRRKISEAGRKISLEISGWNDRVGKIPFKVNTDDWNYILVNDWNPLPAAFKPQLDVLDDGHQVDYRIVDDLVKMLSDAKEEGMDLLVCSAYRSYERQADLFGSSIEELMDQGLTYIDAYYKTREQYAVVSYSEHHTGLAVDIVGKSHQMLDERQGRTKEAIWLAENCARYGFILRYPKGKKNVTGIEYESWHFRYVGKEAAEFIDENDLTFEEFLKTAEADQKNMAHPVPD